jgi:hypothetical protein
MATKPTIKNAECFICEICDFKSSKFANYSIHLSTRKHKLATETPKKNVFLCDCGKEYMDRTGLWKHKKKCQEKNCDAQKNAEIKPDDISMTDKDIIKLLIKENQEFKSLIMDLINKDNTSIVNNNNINNINNINNSFNLNVFLNEKCKDAINISEFVDNIKMQLTDLENFGYLGYVEGVSRIFIKNLKDLDTYSRPIHCSDFKREVLYIKDDNKWTKEQEDKPILKSAIKQIANKNIKQIQTWKQENPECIHSDSRKNDQYINIVMNSMSGGTSEEQSNNISQIVKNVSKAVIIEKPNSVV